MLESLTIKNFGIIESVALDFTIGLNILTGETGAGKSILIDALRFSLGERFQASHIRDQADQCLVSAVFRPTPALLKELKHLLDDFPDDDGAVLIQRSASTDGKNRVKINGLTATVAQLKELGSRLIDFHGPHDHQLLLAENMHIGILDALTDFGKALPAYQTCYAGYCDIRKQLDTLKDLARTRERDLELLTHQVNELEQVPLDDAHLSQLETDRVKVNNAEKLFFHVSQALDCLTHEEAGIEAALTRAYKPLESLSDIDPKAAVHLDELSSVQDSVRALTSALRDYADSLQFDPDHTQDINRQIDIYHDIKRKFGPTLAEALTFHAEAKRKLDLLSDFEHNTSSLQKELQTREKELGALAADLTRLRKKTAALLKKTIEKELQELGFKAVLFEARLESAEFGPAGRDKVVFFISPNAGESLKPLAEIVSSGESARIMLAIKKALMAVDPVPVLIFDEIDAQIGGRLGTTIGTKLKEISAHRQVILITHLPQIAAFADAHFKIQKTVEKGRTRTVVDTLGDHDQIAELAHMMAGDKMTDVAIRHAKAMLKEARGK
ncbi:MAG: DNA repair protein RecN [Candidatus Omnitrophica bacterium]|nr:DNA repair protein RecN [Candidatus Omnitrophota bacterium]